MPIIKIVTYSTFHYLLIDIDNNAYLIYSDYSGEYREKFIKLEYNAIRAFINYDCIQILDSAANYRLYNKQFKLLCKIPGAIRMLENYVLCENHFYARFDTKFEKISARGYDPFSFVAFSGIAYKVAGQYVCINKYFPKRNKIKVFGEIKDIARFCGNKHEDKVIYLTHEGNLSINDKIIYTIKNVKSIVSTSKSSVRVLSRGDIYGLYVSDYHIEQRSFNCNIINAFVDVFINGRFEMKAYDGTLKWRNIKEYLFDNIFITFNKIAVRED